MSVTNRRAAARKMKLRYSPPRRRSVADAIERERRQAAKLAAIKK